jgi:hypothetical protein
VGFLTTGVEPAVLESPRRTALDDLGHSVGIRRIEKDPRFSVELEYARMTAKAFGDVDATFEVEADLDRITAVNLSHPAPEAFSTWRDTFIAAWIRTPRLPTSSRARSTQWS